MKCLVKLLKFIIISGTLFNKEELLMLGKETSEETIAYTIHQPARFKTPTR